MMSGHCRVRNDKGIFLVRFGIGYTLEESSKWVGEEERGDELHCYDLAVAIARARHVKVSHVHQLKPRLQSWHAGTL